MKILITIIALLAVVVFATVWLHAAPQSPPAVPSVPQQTSSSSTPRLTTSGSATASVPTIRPLATTTTHTIGTATATPSTIPVGTSTQVTVSIQITDPAVIANSVNLLRLGAPGTQPVILGRMQNMGNGLYSLQSSFNDPAAGQIQLQISAAFTGSLQRVLSDIMTVSAWDTFTDSSIGFTALYPPSLYIVSGGATDTLSLQSSPQGVAIGGVGPEDGSNATTTGFAVIIQALPYNAVFDINTWLSAQYPNDDVDTQVPVAIGGVPGYEITFKNQVGAGRPTAIVYNHGYIYQISYASTFTPSSSADQSGLSAFNGVLQNFSFSH